MIKALAVVSMTLAATFVWAIPGADGSPVRGTVLETADGGAYIYLKLQTAEGSIWTATTRQAIPTGVQVVIHDPMLMTNFKSKALNRTFDQIVFASAISVEASPTAAPTRAQMTAAHQGAAQAGAGIPIAKVPKAAGPNGRTVAEVYAQRAKLKDKPVAVQGTVVKFSADIMERNWLHLRDGTGAAGDKSNDLMVTTQQKAKVGDVVVVTGVVKTDVDYGSGYAYPVVIEGARLN